MAKHNTCNGKIEDTVLSQNILETVWWWRDLSWNNRRWKMLSNLLELFCCMPDTSMIQARWVVKHDWNRFIGRSLKTLWTRVDQKFSMLYTSRRGLEICWKVDLGK